MEKIKLAIVDDQKLFLEGLRYIVKTFNDIEVILEASNGRELIELIPSKMPDVILMDLKMYVSVKQLPSFRPLEEAG